MEASDVRRLKELEEENRKLKQMYAELSLKHQMFDEIVKKAVKPVQRRLWVAHLMATFEVTISMACDVSGLSRSAYYYAPKRQDDNEVIDAILALVERHARWGFPKIRKRLRRLGHRWNHKRIYRIYLELKLNMRRKSKRRLPARNPSPIAVPDAENRCWSMDFMSDVLRHGNRFRTFNVVDDYNREALAIYPGGSAMTILLVLRPRIHVYRTRRLGR